MLNKKKQNSGALLWNQAKEIIPGGNQLLSKRSEQFLPENWPSYYRSAKGCTVEDLDGNWFRDFSIMGIGTCSLGYSNPEVNEAVIEAIKHGSMSTLNCFEEVELAKALIDLHPWAGGVRFTRSGGESCSVAVRIARAFTGKDIVLFSGYHGWHDWYLATNLEKKENLDTQLLPGLEPNGVPSSLSGTVLPFREGDIVTFDRYLKKHRNKISAVIMEIWRYSSPDLNFIQYILDSCKSNGILVIFDEISSGFRLNNGGSHKIWGLKPDICVLGKALGNGHPIGAIIGKEEVMDAAQSSFISSSYWTERVGFVAALKVLEIFKRDNVAVRLLSIGKKIRDGLESIIKNSELDIKVVGVDSIPILVFGGKHSLIYKTFFTQEMLARGFLAGNLIYVSVAHTENDVDDYLANASEVFNLMANIMPSDLLTLIEGQVCHSGFQRLSKE